MLGRAMLALLVGYQMALTQAAPAVPEADFDLRHVEPDMQAADTIIVTGRRRASQRLAPLPDLADPILPHLETGLFGNARLNSDIVPDVGAMPSVRVTLKIPF